MSAAIDLVRTVSEIQSLQAQIADTFDKINKLSKSEEAIRCFILRLILERNAAACSEMSILSSPFCIVQMGVMRRTIAQREKLEKTLEEIRHILAEKFHQHDHYQQQALIEDLEKLSL